MKVFICALAALILCIILSVWSELYVLNEILNLESAVSSLPETYAKEKGPEDILRSIEKAISSWSSKQTVMCLIINHRDFDEIENDLISVKASLLSEDEGNYSASLAALKEKLSKLRDYERFSIDGIL